MKTKISVLGLKLPCEAERWGTASCCPGLEFASLQHSNMKLLLSAMEKGRENQQRKAKGCNEASQEGKFTNRWVTSLLNMKVILLFFVVLQLQSYSSLLACKAAPGRIAKSYEQNEKFLCTLPPSHVGWKYSPQAFLCRSRRERENMHVLQGFQLIFSISSPTSPLR